ncbi:MAG TPA: 3-dehydro-L-gulonate 2-dehydrogenase [Candidatus Enterocloster faecavium]|uniref:3-dehydro-L-gulonate 2-dehydrogenase n=1 Tax=Candidatus Enterocloster faecavium TaxID=2838560 RepID=A0A9D2L6R7_9FIRM|nr:3-dehydro-L-gulonate 2-dehydrogenase [Candidatus Enterocloster faecavium]
MSLSIPYEVVKETVKKALLQAGLTEEQAEICAGIHAQSSADGVESHGLNRIPRFVQYIRRGWVDLDGKPEKKGAKGAVENYDGHLGIGILNGLFCADRAVELAKVHGIGCVTLRNTTHWMRGGTYAWRMAEAGYAGICWINTESCMPLWGSDEQGVGNNPFCIALPRDQGPVVLDMAMSQYAYGKLGVYRLAGKQLPFPGGFDKDGNLTTDPGAIQESRRILPMGYWKGSAMALALDLAAAMLANGNTGTDMDELGKGSCGSCCQIFIAFDPYLFGEKEEIQKKMDKRIEAAHASHPEREGGRVSYPGERTIATRTKSMEQGVAVDEQIWEQVCSIAEGNLDVADIS